MLVVDIASTLAMGRWQQEAHVLLDRRSTVGGQPTRGDLHGPAPVTSHEVCALVQLDGLQAAVRTLPRHTILTKLRAAPGASSGSTETALWYAK